MSDLPGNPFVTDRLVSDDTDPEHATAHATLAVAHEQRTSNLIDMLTLLHLYEVTATPNPTKAMPDTEQKIQGQLLARLGLEERHDNP